MDESVPVLVWAAPSVSRRSMQQCANTQSTSDPADTWFDLKYGESFTSDKTFLIVRWVSLYLVVELLDAIIRWLSKRLLRMCECRKEWLAQKQNDCFPRQKML